MDEVIRQSKDDSSMAYSQTIPVTVDCILGQIHKRLDKIDIPTQTASYCDSDMAVSRRVENVLKEKIERVCDQVINSRASMDHSGYLRLTEAENDIDDVKSTQAQKLRVIKSKSIDSKDSRRVELISYN